MSVGVTVRVRSVGVELELGKGWVRLYVTFRVAVGLRLELRSNWLVLV